MCNGDLSPVKIQIYYMVYTSTHVVHYQVQKNWETQIKFYFFQVLELIAWGMIPRTN